MAKVDELRSALDAEFARFLEAGRDDPELLAYRKRVYKARQALEKYCIDEGLPVPPPPDGYDHMVAVVRSGG
jgi:hypothetical protein